MGRPRNREFDLKERLAKAREAGLTQVQPVSTPEEECLAPFPERIRIILGILQDKPIKSTTMNYLILYDIENNKVRRLVAKYLEKQGCTRVQKSVFLIRSDHQKFESIRQALAEVNDAYDNQDSIILVPMNISDARSMKLIGKNVNISQIIDPPNTVFL